MSDSPAFFYQVYIDTSTSGDNTIIDISSVLGTERPNMDSRQKALKRIFVVSYSLSTAGAVDIIWKTGSTSKDKVLFGAAGRFSPNDSKAPGLFWGDAEEDLILNLSGEVNVTGSVVVHIT